MADIKTRASTRTTRRLDPTTAPEPALDRRILDFVKSESLAGRSVDGELVELPPEDGAIAFSLEWDGATLDLNVSWEQIDDMIRSVQPVIDANRKSGDDGRAFAREAILQCVAANQHLRPEGASAVASLAAWLAFTGPQGPRLRQLDIKHFGYVISGPDGNRNFRLIAGR
jgi:hypothetical protein